MWFGRINSTCLLNETLRLVHIWIKGFSVRFIKVCILIQSNDKIDSNHRDTTQLPFHNMPSEITTKQILREEISDYIIVLNVHTVTNG